MSEKQAGPRGWLPATAPEYLSARYSSSSARHWQPARCELHGIHIVDRFPRRCPLATPNPLATIAQIQDAAWVVLGRGFSDPELPSALALLDGNDVCMGCMERILTHPTVQRLRARKAAAA